MRIVVRFVMMVVVPVVFLCLVRYACLGFQGNMMPSYESLATWFNAFPNPVAEIKGIVDYVNGNTQLELTGVQWWDVIRGVWKVVTQDWDGMKWLSVIGQVLWMTINLPIRVVVWLFTFFGLQ